MMDLQHGLRFVEETSVRASTGKYYSKIQNCRIHSTDKSRGVCGRAVNTSNSGSGVPDSSLARRVVSSDKELYSTSFLFTQMYTGDVLLGGNPAID